jgi:hypothetical protein
VLVFNDPRDKLLRDCLRGEEARQVKGGDYLGQDVELKSDKK